MKNGVKLGLDVMMTLALLLLMVPKLLGQSIHEWAGIIIAAVIVFHLVLNWSWIKSVTVRFFGKASFRARFTYILNLLVFCGFAGIITSGLFISKTIDFSWLGLSKGGAMGWKQLHTSLSYLSFLLAGIHLGLNFPWVLRMFKPAGRLSCEGSVDCES